MDQEYSTGFNPRSGGVVDLSAFMPWLSSVILQAGQPGETLTVALVNQFGRQIANGQITVNVPQVPTNLITCLNTAGMVWVLDPQSKYAMPRDLSDVEGGIIYTANADMLIGFGGTPGGGLDIADTGILPGCSPFMLIPASTALRIGRVNPALVLR